MVKVGVIADEGDPHGYTIFHSSVYRGTYYADTALIGTVATKLQYVPQIDILIVADLPVDRNNVERTVQAYKKAAERTQVIFLDHHRTTANIVNALSDAGVKVVLTNGIMMSYFLVKLLNGDLNVIDEDLDGIFRSFATPIAEDLLRTDIGKLMLFGNRADMDIGFKQVYKNIDERLKQLIEDGGMGISYLFNMHGKALITLKPATLVKTAIITGKRIREGKIDWPPSTYAREIERIGKAFSDVLIVDGEKVQHIGGWRNRAVSHLFSNSDYRYVIIYNVGPDPRTGEEKAAISVYAPWLSDINLLDELNRNSIKEELATSSYVKNCAVYGHPTFAIIGCPLKEDVDINEVKKWAKEKAIEIAEMLEEH